MSSTAVEVVNPWRLWWVSYIAHIGKAQNILVLIQNLLESTHLQNQEGDGGGIIL